MIQNDDVKTIQMTPSTSQQKTITPEPMLEQLEQVQKKPPTRKNSDMHA
jgi:hypothetical protein